MSRMRRILILWAWLMGFVLFLPWTAIATSGTPQATTPSPEKTQTDTGKKKKKKEKTSENKPADTSSPSPAAKSETSKPAPPTAVENKTAPPAASPSKSGAGKAAPSGAASESEIAAAKSSGKVWVNLDSGVYHKGGRYYGNTKNGKFMTEAEAQKAGYRQAKNE